MQQLPPRSTLTDQLLPYTTPFRTEVQAAHQHNDLADRVGDGRAEKPVLAQSDVERRQVDKSMADRGIGAQLGAVQGEIDRPHMTREREQATADRSEEHTSELQSLMRTYYAVFCLKQQNTNNTN